MRILENYSCFETVSSRDLLVIHQFLFMSYTGMRYSDFASMTKDNVSKEGGQMWLTYTSVKTNVFVRLPLSVLFDGRAEQLISRYANKLDEFFHIACNSQWNRAINKIAKKARVGCHISSHVARHTFASRLINKGVPLSTIQKVIGHRSINTTMTYARLNEQSIVRQLSI